MQQTSVQPTSIQQTLLAGPVAIYVALGVKIAALLFLAWYVVVCVSRLTGALKDDPLQVETSWGGLGGSLGGWTMSKSLGWLLATLLTVTLFAGLASQLTE